MNTFTAMSGQKLQSYWSRPGGKFKLTLLFGLLGGVFYWKILPILLTMVWGTVQLVGGAIVLWILYFMLTNRTLRLNLLLFWDILMKYTIGLAWNWDPFVAAERRIKTAKRDREEIDRQNDAVGKELQSTVSIIEEAIEEKATNFRLAEEAKSNGPAYDGERQVALANIGFAEDRINELTPVKELLEKVYAQLTQIYRDSEVTIRTMEARLKSDKIKYGAIMSSGQAFASAIKFFKGNPEEIFAAEQMAIRTKDQISQQLYGMKKNLQLSNDFLRTIKLDKSSAAAKGEEILKLMKSNNNDPTVTIETSAEVIERRRILR